MEFARVWLEPVCLLSLHESLSYGVLYVTPIALGCHAFITHQAVWFCHCCICAATVFMEELFDRYFQLRLAGQDAGPHSCQGYEQPFLDYHGTSQFALTVVVHLICIPQWFPRSCSESVAGDRDLHFCFISRHPANTSHHALRSDQALPLGPLSCLGWKKGRWPYTQATCSNILPLCNSSPTSSSSLLAQAC